MTALSLWHVHDKNGSCCGVTASYEVAFVICMKLYIEYGKTESFFATQHVDAKLNKTPLPNS